MPVVVIVNVAVVNRVPEFIFANKEEDEAQTDPSTAVIANRERIVVNRGFTICDIVID